jgi:hypothetical protein
MKKEKGCRPAALAIQEELTRARGTGAIVPQTFVRSARVLNLPIVSNHIENAVARTANWTTSSMPKRLSQSSSPPAAAQ